MFIFYSFVYYKYIGDINLSILNISQLCVTKSSNLFYIVKQNTWILLGIGRPLSIFHRYFPQTIYISKQKQVVFKNVRDIIAP